MTIAEFINEVGFKVREGDVDKVNGTISQIKNTATKILGVIGIGLSLTNMNALVEEFGRVNDQVHNSTKELGDQLEIQQQILEAATKTRSAYSQTASVVSDLVHENSELFGTIEEAVAFNNAATMLFKTAGKTNEEIAGLMEAMNKSFAKGYVDSETLSQLLERSPEAIELINKRLGSTSDQIEQLASDGVFTVQDLKAAFVDNMDAIEKGFGNVKVRVTDALTVIRNKWGMWLYDTDEMLEVTSTIANVMMKGFDTVLRVITRVRTAIVWLSDGLGGFENMLKLVAIVAGSLWVAFNADKIAKVLKTILTAVTTLDKGLLLLAAKFIVIALIVEDFIQFLLGNNSVFGEFLEAAGIDADKFRQQIFDTFQNIVNFILPLWEGFTQALSDFWNEHGDEIKAAVETVGAVIGTVFGAVGKAIMTVVGAITGSETAKDVIKDIGEFIGILATAIGAAIPVVAAFAAIITILNSPILLVIAAITALITIGYLLVENWDKIKEYAQKIWNNIASFFSSVLSKIKTTFSNVWNNIKTTLSNIWNNIKNTASNFISNIYSSLSNGLNNIKNTFTNIWTNIKDFLSNAVETIKTNVTTTFTNIWTSITTTVGNIKESIVSGFQSAIDWITGLPEQAITWGKDIIDAIVEGINSAIDNVVTAAKEIAQIIKDHLGFSEPEVGPLSNFHTYMPDMIDLMTEGIEDNKKKVIGAMESLAGDMSVLATSTVVSAPTASIVSGSSVRNINMNVEFNNEFNGDTAIQRHAASTMKKSADDITATLARGLAYA